MPSIGIKPPVAALFPTAADRSTLNTHQSYYLSPPLTPFPSFPPYNEELGRASPHRPAYPPGLPALQEMLPHERRASVDPSQHHQYPAIRRPSEREIKHMSEHNSLPKFQGGPNMNDPTRLLPIYSPQSQGTVGQPSSNGSPLVRRNKAHVASACVNCKKAHLACDGNCPPLFPLCLLKNLFPFPVPGSAALRRMCVVVKRRLAVRPNFWIIFNDLFLRFHVPHPDWMWRTG